MPMYAPEPPEHIAVPIKPGNTEKVCKTKIVFVGGKEFREEVRATHNLLHEFEQQVKSAKEEVTQLNAVLRENIELRNKMQL